MLHVSARTSSSVLMGKARDVFIPSAVLHCCSEFSYHCDSASSSACTCSHVENWKSCDRHPEKKLLALNAMPLVQ